MYRKDADRKIIRDVRQRLADKRSADWMAAVFHSRAENPSWYRHHNPNGDFASVQQLLREAGVDMSRAKGRFNFIANEGVDS